MQSIVHGFFQVISLAYQPPFCSFVDAPHNFNNSLPLHLKTFLQTIGFLQSFPIFQTSVPVSGPYDTPIWDDGNEGPMAPSCRVTSWHPWHQEESRRRNRPWTIQWRRTRSDVSGDRPIHPCRGPRNWRKRPDWRLGPSQKKGLKERIDFLAPCKLQDMDVFPNLGLTFVEHMCFLSIAPSTYRQMTFEIISVHLKWI